MFNTGCIEIGVVLAVVVACRGLRMPRLVEERRAKKLRRAGLLLLPANTDDPDL